MHATTHLAPGTFFPWASLDMRECQQPLCVGEPCARITASTLGTPWFVAVALGLQKSKVEPISTPALRS